MSLQTAAYQAVQRDITITFDRAVQAAEPFWPLICTFVPSNSLDEKYGWLGDVPGMREWLGDREFKQLRAADYTLANKHWESSLGVEKNDVDDDRMGMLGTRIGQLADEASYHPDELLFAEVINTADATACYDGQFFYDTDHVWGDSGTQDNDLTYNATTANDPTPDEFKASFHAALIQMLGFKNDQGKPFMRPRVGKLGNLLCRVPINMYEAANKAFEQTIVLEGGAGVSNWTIERPTVVCVQYMSAGYTNGSDTKWHLDYLGGALKPFVFQGRKPLQFAQKGADDLETKLLKTMTEARYNAGLLAWFYSVQTTFT